MKAMRIVTIFLVIATLLLSGCAKGNIKGTVRHVGHSYIFTTKDIQDAMDMAMKHFKDHFSGCSLREISYDDAVNTREASAWAEQYGADEAIVLTSSFYVDASGGNGSLNPNSVYNGWKWVLTRSNGGKWTLQTWGYG